jgi:hypothetical protein
MPNYTVAFDETAKPIQVTATQELKIRIRGLWSIKRDENNVPKKVRNSYKEPVMYLYKENNVKEL